MRLLYIMCALLLLAAASARAQVGCVPNPNLNGPPFIDGCPLPASALNNAFAKLALQTPMGSGAKGDGVTDDTLAVQKAITAAANAGTPLYFDSIHLYKVTSTLNITSPVTIQGPMRYGPWTTKSNGAAPSCTWGLIATGNFTLLNVSAVTATIQGVCMQLANGPATSATAGAAIQLAPPDVNSYQTGVTVQFNTILYPYDGVTINGAGYNSACCGKGTTADGNLIAWNTIVNPADVGISNGKNTAGASTVGNTLWDNAIMCGLGGGVRGIGIALYDGAIWYDGTQNGPLGCAIGTLVAPGTVSGTSQNAELNADGVFGDQSLTHDLQIKPTGTGTVDFVTIGGKGPWAGATSNYNSVLIDCTGASVSCQEFNFTGMVAHGGTGEAQPVFDVEAGAGGPYDLSITGSDICQFGSSVAGAIALKLNIGAGPGGRFTVVGNRIGTGCPGTSNATGISLTINTGATTNGSVTIMGNDISSAATPIAYTPNSSDYAIIVGNMGIDNVSGNVPVTGATTSITAPINNTFGLSGSGTPTITSIVGGWQNRSITMVNAEASTISFGTGGPAGSGICSAASIAAGQMLLGRFNYANGCWNLK